MKEEIIFLIEKLKRGGYEARALGYPIYAKAKDLEHLNIKIDDAVRTQFETTEMPEIKRLHLVKSNNAYKIHAKSQSQLTVELLESSTASTSTNLKK
jgi:hypothetical protein